jgi:hypothetical protein
MIRVNRALVALLLAVFVAVPAFAQTSGQEPAKKFTFLNPVRGVADIEMLRPVIIPKGNEVITTLKIKNVSKEPIAGFKVDEIWWSRDRSLVPGGSQYRHKKPFMPGEILTIELRTVKDAKMYTNQFQFSHANGSVKPKTVPKFVD